MKLACLLAPLGIAEGLQTWKYPILYTTPARQNRAAPLCACGAPTPTATSTPPGAAQAGAAVVVAEEPVEAPGAQVISGAGHPQGPGPDERRLSLEPRRGGHLRHRRDRHQGQDHHRLYDPLHPGGCRPQDRGHRHHWGADWGGADPDRQHHPHELRYTNVSAPHGGRRLRLLRDGGLLHRPEGSAGLRVPLFSGGVHQLLRGPHRRGGAQGHAGVSGEQGKAVLPVQGGRGQRRRPQRGGHPPGPHLPGEDLRL